jgi:hypothetical protein
MAKVLRSLYLASAMPSTTTSGQAIPCEWASLEDNVTDSALLRRWGGSRDHRAVRISLGPCVRSCADPGGHASSVRDVRRLGG